MPVVTMPANPFTRMVEEGCIDQGAVLQIARAFSIIKGALPMVQVQAALRYQQSLTETVNRMAPRAAIHLEHPFITTHNDYEALQLVPWAKAYLKTNRSKR